MAQGCILPLTMQDEQDLRRSLDNPLGRAAYAEAAHAVSIESANQFANALALPLTDPTHPAHAMFSETAVANIAGNESISPEFKGALPRAIAMIAEQTPDILGLITPSRGRGATSWASTVKNPRVGDGFAYEVLGTAELIRRDRQHNKGSTSTNGGRQLRVYRTDRVDLGVKFQAAYGEAGVSNGLYRPASPRSPGKYRATFEADALIRRDDGHGSWFTIGIDFKHARGGGDYRGNLDDLRAQLKGISNGIKTGDMGLEEFHFATNGTFSPEFRREVDKHNEGLAESSDRSGPPRIALHEGFQFPLS